MTLRNPDWLVDEICHAIRECLRMPYAMQEEIASKKGQTVREWRKSSREYLKRNAP